MAISAISLIITIVLLLKRRRAATSVEEQEKVDELIQNQLLIAMTQIKDTCKQYKINYSTKQLNNMAKAAIKESKTNGTTENAQ